MMSGVGILVGAYRLRKRILGFTDTFELDQVVNKTNRLYFILFPLVSIMSLLTVIIIWTSVVEYGVISSFRHRLTILSPVITDQEGEELQSNWASMSSRADHDLLAEEMEKIANERGIQLPEIKITR
ncbi:MAG: hypothetical protein O7G13_15325 [Alphaproteobacteria bacterium]|nr:hypothetical protein [Alphaproteobacteria bacterium]